MLSVLSKTISKAHERVLAVGGVAKLPRSNPWAIYSDAPVPDLNSEASTSGSESDRENLYGGT